MVRLTTLTAVLALAACADTGDEGMIVLNNTAVPAASCTLSGAAGQPFISHGQIFAKSPTGYFLTPLIQSRIVQSDSTDSSQRTILLTGANISLDIKAVTIEHADGSFSNGTVTLPAQQAKFSALFSGSLPPAGTVNVGFEVIPVQALRTILTSSGAGPTDHMTAEVLATITVLGTLGGDKMSASPFQYPISVCNDCVVNVVGTCPLPVGSTVRPGNACNVFQDGAVDCCTEANGSVSCPAPVATM